MSDEAKLLRKVIVIFLLALFAFFLAIQLYNHLTTGKVTIKTSNPANYVRITQSVDTSSGNKLFSKDAKQQMSIRVKPGSYQISAYVLRGQNSVSQTIVVKARQSRSYTISPLNITNPEPVYGEQAGSVVADSSQLLFLGLSGPGDDSNGSGKLLRADVGGGFSTLFPDHSFAKIAWANPQLGLAQDTFNNLYVIENGQLSQLGLPFTTSPNTKLTSDINKSGGIYISNGRDVYVGSVSGNFKKIYAPDSDEAVTGLTAGNNKVGVVTNAVEALESKRNGSKANGAIAIIGDSGSVIKKPFDVLGASWSPNSKYLLVNGALSGVVFDSSLHQLSSISANNASNLVWRNNSSVFYSINGQLWLYDLPTKMSNKITQLLTGGNVSSIYPSIDDAYVYFSSEGNKKTQLFRVGLKGQAIDNSLNALPVFLPEVIHNCSLNYLSFGKTSILVGSPPNQSPQDCIGTAQEEAQYYQLNVGALQFLAQP